jgi:hypothetical protein
MINRIGKMGGIKNPVYPDHPVLVLVLTRWGNVRVLAVFLDSGEAGLLRLAELRSASLATTMKINQGCR